MTVNGVMMESIGKEAWKNEIISLHLVEVLEENSTGTRQ